MVSEVEVLHPGSTMRAASEWLTARPEHRPDLVEASAVTPSLPASMPAAMYRRAGVIEVVDHPLPDVGPRDVLLEVSHCGVCGSDLHLVLEGWGRAGLHRRTRVHRPGRRRRRRGRRWSIGDEVVAGPGARCGECRPCRSGRAPLCLARDAVGASDFQGAFAQYARVSAEELLAVPPGLALRAAALAEPLAVALHGITLADIEPGDRVIVFGAGPIGRSPRQRSPPRAIRRSPWWSPARVARSWPPGWERVLHPDQLAAGMAPREPRGRAVRRRRPRVLGSGRRHGGGARPAGRAGRLVLVGAGMERPSFDPNRILLNELVLTGAFTYDADGFPRALALLSRAGCRWIGSSSPGRYLSPGCWTP